MKLVLAAARQILLELSAEEMQTYVFPDGNGAACAEGLRRTLQRILDDLAETTGRRFRLEKSARADLLPDRSGGCLLIVSGLKQQTGAVLQQCYFAQDENELIDAARAVCGAGERQTRITLLQYSGGYLLLTPGLSARAAHTLSEFMRVTELDETAAEALKEQCRPLLENKPLSSLCGGA